MPFSHITYQLSKLAVWIWLFVTNASSLIRSLSIVRTSHRTLLLSIAVNMASNLLLLAMIMSSAMATNINTGNPPDFLRFWFKCQSL